MNAAKSASQNEGEDQAGGDDEFRGSGYVSGDPRLLRWLAKGASADEPHFEFHRGSRGSDIALAETSPDLDDLFVDAIVVPVRSAEDAHRLLPSIIYFSSALGRSVELVSVIDDTFDVPTELLRLAEVTRRIGAAVGHATRCRIIVSDDPAADVLDVCADRIVCMPTSASPFRQQHFVGSYAASLLARSTEPVILIGPHVRAEDAVSFGDLTVALAGDENCLAVLPVARGIAERLGLDVRVVHVMEDHDDHATIDNEGNARLWFPDGLHTSLAVEPLATSDVSASLAERAATSLLVVATHARCGLERIAEGSVAFDVIAAATAPIVVVGPRIEEVGAPEVAPAPHRHAQRVTGTPTHAADELRSILASGGTADEVFYTPAIADVLPNGEFVVVLDGSERSAEAIPAAKLLAEQSGHTLSVVAVVPPEQATAIRATIDSQLADHFGDHVPVAIVDPLGMQTELLDLARGGHVVVASAFGTWTTSTRLFGLVGSLVSANAPGVVGIGPAVFESWQPDAAGPIVVCVDESAAAHSIIEKLDAFVTPGAQEIIVLHIDQPICNVGPKDVRPDSRLTGWADVARRIEQRWNVTASVQTITGASVPGAITAFADSVGASLIVMASHHRPLPGRPTVASASLSTVAYAPCPVGILSAV